MNNLIKSSITTLSITLMLCSCGTGSIKSTARKGWDKYISTFANGVGISVSEAKKTLENNLTHLNYVYTFDSEGDVIYYQGKYGTSNRPETMFYFLYLVKEDYASDVERKAYQFAKELVEEGEMKGEISYLI